MVKKSWAILAVLAALPVAAWSSVTTLDRNQPTASAAPKPDAVAAKPVLAGTGQLAPAAPVPDEVPVALLVDLSSHQILFAREAGRRFMPASVTKVMTAYTAFKLIGDGKLKPESPVLISQQLEDDWSGEGSSMFLKAGQKPTVGQLILGATTVSGNDATVALGIYATGSVAKWTALMNANAAALGMTETWYHSPNGYPDGGRTFTTAHDLALLGEALVTRYPRFYYAYFGHHGMTWGKITQANHDPVTGHVEGGDGIKTGFTNEAGYTFIGSAERDGRRLIVVIGGAPTASARNDAARALLDWGFARFAARRLFPGGAVVGQARVQDGMMDSVELRAPAEIAAAMPLDGKAQPTLSIRYRGPVNAPVEKGEAIAVLHIETPGFEPVEVPLEAASAVPRANAWQRLVNGVEGLLG